MDHLIDRYRKGRITPDDFLDLKHWLEADPDVPAGLWYKRFRRFTLAGDGEFVKTFLDAGMAPKGEEVR